MKMVKPALAGAFASLCATNSSLMQSNFVLSPLALKEFEEALAHAYYQNSNDESRKIDQKELHLAVAEACLRRKAYQAFDKFVHMSTPEEVEDALEQTILTETMQEQLLRKKPRPKKEEPPKTWKDELDYLQTLSKSQPNPKEWLWRQLLNHPMTDYVPVHCPQCGHVVPDSYTPGSSLAEEDAKVGMRERDPTGEELALRSGWFRGPRGTIVFEITCTHCQHVYTWYRTGNVKLLLALNRGRLCGEQEDLRLSLANYLGINIRMALPLDWDHVWTEYQCDASRWQVADESARNFACRLDEGIGTWTGVLAVHPNPNLCQDVTEEYLTCQSEGGRVDPHHSHKLLDYRKKVYDARLDSSFQATQAGTGVGFIIARAGLTSNQVSDILKVAAKDFERNGPWWRLRKLPP